MDGRRRNRLFQVVVGKPLPESDVRSAPTPVILSLSIRRLTAFRNTGTAIFGSTFPALSFNSLLAVISSSIPLVPISNNPSLTPFASAPLRSTSSSTIPYFWLILCGMFIWRLELIMTGRDFNRETVVRSVERWERVCVRSGVFSCDGGRRRGSGPRRRDEWRGPWSLRCDSKVDAEGGWAMIFAWGQSVQCAS